jgi:hypothetical protein
MDRVIFRANETQRPLGDLYAAEEAEERRERVATELARLMYQAGTVIKSERWDNTDVNVFLDRLRDGVDELKRGLGDDFDPSDPLRQWGAWFDPITAQERRETARQSVEAAE